ncbi:acetyl-CoA hydrolase/transferase C-terminal domain-containing protein [Nocardioides sp. LHD-245]|uniref:acetyl-CoA hydrolase/transferase family protein n=1 Tax=Nocardioides sp. LHD-245 TaxID=3051387 RepID=UPI0027E1F971|nr:acetyl-CoA hydrolase/transferase C-terminal domain-containing protein [Nocardioides sp. LHD-245]
MATTIGAAQALERHVAPGHKVLLGTAAGAATTLQRQLVDQQERLSGLRLMGGMQLGGYDFMPAVREGRFTYDTWHVTTPVRDDVATGQVGFHLVRGGAVPGLLRRLAPDVFLTTVSPPVDGQVSFGASVSYALHACEHVPTLIAQVNPDMPRTRGNALVPVERFAALVDAEDPLPQHRGGEPSELEAGIATTIRDLIPDDATVQIGLGGVPEALVAHWGDDPPPGLRVYGMGVDGMVPLLERLGRPGAFVGGELLGTDALYGYAHEQPTIQQVSLGEMLSVPAIAAIPRFVSVNSAIEIDLSGQVNAEWAGGKQVSGPGGSFDFLDGASLSDGGVSIFAMRSTARGGTVSTIVPRLGPGVPVTTPRHAVQVIVTEYGVADLRGLTVRQRGEALVAIADPRFRDELAAHLG